MLLAPFPASISGSSERSKSVDHIRPWLWPHFTGFTWTDIPSDGIWFVSDREWCVQVSCSFYFSLFGFDCLKRSKNCFFIWKFQVFSGKVKHENLYGLELLFAFWSGCRSLRSQILEWTHSPLNCSLYEDPYFFGCMCVSSPKAEFSIVTVWSDILKTENCPLRSLSNFGRQFLRRSARVWWGWSTRVAI